MRRIVKPKDEPGAVELLRQCISAPPVSKDLEGCLPNLDANSQLNRLMEALRYEVAGLLVDARIGRLDEKSSRSLCNYIKILHDIVRDESAILDDLSDDQLQKIVEERDANP